MAVLLAIPLCHNPQNTKATVARYGVLSRTFPAAPAIASHGGFNEKDYDAFAGRCQLKSC
jgi:hypothetical protein